MVDIAAPLTSDKYAGIGTFTFDVTGTLDIPEPPGSEQSCDIVDVKIPAVEGNPCAVSIGTVAASSIEAKMTAMACAYPPVMSCTTTSKSNTTTRYRGGGMGTGMAVLRGLMAGVW